MREEQLLAVSSLISATYSRQRQIEQLLSRNAKGVDMTDRGSERSWNGDGKGAVILFTGDGKGKTTAALGCSLRAAGRGMKTLIIQFMKDRGSSGEHLLSSPLSMLIQVHPFGAGFLRPGDDPGPHRKVVREAWEKMKGLLRDDRFDLLVLDELAYVLHAGLLPQEPVIGFLEGRGASPHVIITGRSAPQWLIDRADMVTEMREVKHPYHQGLPPIPGIDY
jgi:cob(I)alamin adenosyltransferase